VKQVYCLDLLTYIALQVIYLPRVNLHTKTTQACYLQAQIRRTDRLADKIVGRSAICVIWPPLRRAAQGREMTTWSLLEKNPHGSDSVVAYWIKQVEGSVLEASSSSVKQTEFAGPRRWLFV